MLNARIASGYSTSGEGAADDAGHVVNVIADLALLAGPFLGVDDAATSITRNSPGEN
ncbi:MAG: hypothetical protein ACRCSP_01485 [Rhodoglobus sp.]